MTSVPSDSAFYVLHGDEGYAGVGFTHVVHDTDVRMIEGRGGFGLGRGTAAGAAGSARQLGRQELDRRLAVEPSVFGEKDFPHAAGTELGRDQIMADRLADHLSYLARGGIVESESCSVTLPDRRQRRGETANKNCICVGRATSRSSLNRSRAQAPGVVLKARRGNARPTATVRAVG